MNFKIINRFNFNDKTERNKYMTILISGVITLFNLLVVILALTNDVSWHIIMKDISNLVAWGLITWLSYLLHLYSVILHEIMDNMLKELKE